MQKHFHRIFELGIFLKAVNGVIEIISGSLVLFVSKTTFYRIFLLLARRELFEDPNDKVVIFASRFLLHLSADTKIFVAAYILAHGLVNIFLAFGLHRRKPWSYPAAIAFISAVIVYQIYRVAVHHSLTLAAITVFDCFFVWLTWREYKFHMSANIKKLL